MENIEKLIAAIDSLRSSFEKSAKPKRSSDSGSSQTSPSFNAESIIEQNTLFKEQSTLFADLNVSLEEQAELFQKISKNGRDLDKDFERIGSKIAYVSKSLTKVIDVLSNLKEKFSPKNLKKALTNTIESISNKAKKTRAVFKAIQAENKEAGGGILRLGGQLTKFYGGSFLKLMGKGGPVIGAITLVGKTVLGVMVSAFKTAISYGTKFVKFMTSLPMVVSKRAAVMGDAIRKELVEGIGNAVESLKEAFSLDTHMGEGINRIKLFAESSLLDVRNYNSEVFKLFGESSSKIVEELGTALSSMDQFSETVGKSIMTSGESFLEFYKATKILGMSNEDIKYFAMESFKSLKPIHQIFDNIGTSLKNTAKQFNVDFKRLGKNFFQLRKDITNFGHLSDVQLQQTSAKLQQLGLDASAATAVFSKFQTFEDAAQSAALLSQTFGMNVDALKLIKAEKPEEIIEMFRSSLLAAGRSFDNMNRHEKALMAQYTGLSAEQLNMIMNYRNMGKSYEEIQKMMEDTDPQKVQIKSLKEMTGSLKQLRKTLENKGFFENFADGVVNTMSLNTGLKETFVKASEALELFYYKGLSLSEGSKKALENMMNPFRETIDKLVDPEKGFFTAEKIGGAIDETIKKLEPVTALLFNKEKKLVNVGKARTTFESILTQIFSPNTFKNPTGSVVASLMATSGELIGQFLRAFAAIGPGIADTIATAFTDLVDWLSSAGSPGWGLSKTFANFFKLGEEDTKSINKAITDIFGSAAKLISPLSKLFMWVQKKVIGMLGEIIPVLTDGLIVMMSEVVPDLFKTDSMRQSVALAKDRSRLRESKDTDTFTKEEVNSLINSDWTDSSQMAANAKLISNIEKAMQLNIKDENLYKELTVALKGVKKYAGEGSELYNYLQVNTDVLDTINKHVLKTNKIAREGVSSQGMGNVDEFNEMLADSVARINSKKTTKESPYIQTYAEKRIKYGYNLNDGSISGMNNAIVPDRSNNGLSVIRFDSQDEVIAGKKGGPVTSMLSEIYENVKDSYSGKSDYNVTTEIDLIKKILLVNEVKKSKSNRENQESSVVKNLDITLNIDGNKLGGILLKDINLMDKARDPNVTGPSARLASNALTNTSGASTESSSMS